MKSISWHWQHDKKSVWYRLLTKLHDGFRWNSRCSSRSSVCHANVWRYLTWPSKLMRNNMTTVCHFTYWSLYMMRYFRPWKLNILKPTWQTSVSEIAYLIIWCSKLAGVKSTNNLWQNLNHMAMLILPFGLCPLFMFTRSQVTYFIFLSKPFYWLPLHFKVVEKTS